MSLWVVDTSPLIFLAKLDGLDLLEKGAERAETASSAHN
jgi:hypothetical protein